MTPEYPNGIYCYFATVDANWNSAYPYVVGPTFYGNIVAAKVTTVPAGTTTYTPGTSGLVEHSNTELNVNVFPNPTSELLVVQLLDLNREDTELALYDISGKLIDKTMVYQGATIGYFDTKTYYAGSYILKISNTTVITTKKVVITK